jgi:hypothetical protein
MVVAVRAQVVVLVLLEEAQAVLAVQELVVAVVVLQQLELLSLAV